MAASNPNLSTDQALEQAAADLYDARMPYHNFTHVQTVLRESLALIERAESVGLQPNKRVIRAAILLHDAHYHEPHRTAGYASKELYSAALARGLLPAHGYKRAEVDAVSDAIASTQCGVKCQSLEAKIVKGADLAGLAYEYPVFLQNACALWQEEEWLLGQLVPWISWRDRAVNYVAAFLQEDLGFSPACYASHDQTWLQKNAHANLDKLQAQEPPL
ncbi:MAG: HD domain-containing protein [Gammaproteobacteria bacterium]